MAIQLDHLILRVNDCAESVAFYRDVIGLAYEGEDGDFSMMRVTPDLLLLFGAYGTDGGEHVAFSMSRAEFDAVKARLVDKRIPYGDHFDTVGTMQGPGEERGARGQSASIYFHDPNRHLLEIKHYGA